MKALVTLLIAGIQAAVALATESTDFSRYQVIIDHSPFGSVAAGSAAEAAPNFALRFQFVALVMSNGGAGPLQAIIFDKEGNRSYFKAAGEPIVDGVKVVSVEREPAKVVLQSGLEKAQLVFQTRPSTAGAGMPGQPGSPTPGSPGFAPGQPPPINRPRIPFRRSN